MSKIAAENTVTIPKEEYNLLKEVYKTVPPLNTSVRSSVSPTCPVAIILKYLL